MKEGRIIAGRYSLQAVAGTGGMGRVYRALDQRTGKTVALKVLNLDAKKYSRRFAREADVMAQLQHPNIIAYVDYGVTELGAPFIVMEWAQGEDLRQRMNRKRVSLEEARRIIAGVSEALAFAHERGIIHRDLKPSNLMLVDRNIDKIKLLDFGIARWRGPSVEKMTRTGISIGTPGYMAPEQGEGKADIDGRADLYALGCVIFECLVGYRPFQGEDQVAVLARAALGQAPRVSERRRDISPEFDQILADMMSADPAGRPSDGHVLHRRVVELASAQVDPDQSTATARTPSAHAARCILLIEGLGEHTAVLKLNRGKKAVQEVSDDTLMSVLDDWGSCTKLKDGTILVHFDGPTGDTDPLTWAARCALFTREMRPSSAIALGSDPGEHQGEPNLGMAIRRAAKQLATSRRDALDLPEPSPAIYIDDATARHLDARFMIQGSTDTQGNATVHLIGERSDTSTLTAAAAKAFVGRDNEFSVLSNAFEECIGNERARAILLSGEAGIGKSRLCDEVEAQLRHQHPDTVVWRGRGDAMNKGAAFHLVGQLIRQAIGCSPDDELDVRRNKLVDRIGELFDQEHVQGLSEFLGEISGTPFSIEQCSMQFRAARDNSMLMGDQIRRAWESFLAAELTHRPVLIILEDLHWGDLSSVRLIDGALRNLTQGRWMLIALARPEVYDVFPGLWQGRAVGILPLGPLDKPSCREILLQRLGDEADDDDIDRLINLSGGNPLYLEELARAELESPGGPVPKSILDMVQSRLQKLDHDSRRILRAASVFGRVFWRGGVEALLGPKAEAIDVGKLLDDLSILKLVKHHKASQLAGEEQFAFQQELVREAAYSSLSADDASLGHHLAAPWLVARGFDDAFALSNHYLLGRDLRQAARHFARAARQSLEGNDMGAAVELALRGLECDPENESRGRLYQCLGSAYLWTGDPQRAADASAKALELLPPESDAWTLTAGDRVTALGRCGKFDDIVEICNQLLARDMNGASSGALVMSLARAASRLFLGGRFEEGALILKRLRGEEAELAPATMGHLFAARANQELCDGDPGHYLSLSDKSAEAFERCGDRRAATMGRTNMGFAYNELGDYQSAIDELRSALSIAQEMQLDSLAALARNNLGRSLLCTGELDEAWDLELIAIESFLLQGDDRLANGSRIYLSQIYQKKGELESAEREAREAVSGSEHIPAVHMHANAQLASVLLERGQAPYALVAALTAVDLLDEIGQVDEGESLARLKLGESYLACGHEAQGIEAIGAAHRSLQKRAERIAEKHWKNSFLHRVEENAKTVLLAEHYGLADTP